MKKILFSLLFVLLCECPVLMAQEKKDIAPAELNFSFGYSFINSMTNLSPFGLQYSSDFRKPAVKVMSDLSFYVDNDIRLGLQWGVSNFSTYLADKGLNNSVSMDFIGMNVKDYFLRTKSVDIVGSMAVGPVFYKDEIRNGNGDKSNIKSTGLGANFSLSSYYKFKKDLMLGLRLSDDGGTFYKWRGNSGLINTKSYNLGSKKNRWNAFSIELLFDIGV